MMACSSVPADQHQLAGIAVQECEVLVFRTGTKLKIRFGSGWDWEGMEE